MTDVLKIEKEDQVAIVTLSRPEKHNAVNLDMFTALIEAGKTLGSDRSVRAIVLAGEGASFCAGIDLSVFQSGGLAQLTENMAPAADSPANFYQRAAYVWREVPVPVICAMHGVAYGAGLQIALGADLRYASSDCQLSIMEIKWGIIPDMAITRTMAGILPVDVAKELAWTGRQVAADEALRLGLITGVVDEPREHAMQVAQGLAARSPDAVRAIKQLFEEAPTLSVADALQLEARLQMTLLGTANQAEAVGANMEKRAPKFAD